jgi:hypothetical protein
MNISDNEDYKSKGTIVDKGCLQFARQFPALIFSIVAVIVYDPLAVFFMQYC